MIVPITKVQLRQDEDGVWIAKSSLLPGCHAHGRDRGEAILRFQQAAKVHLEALLETGRPIPPAFRDKFVLAACVGAGTRPATAANWNGGSGKSAANCSSRRAATGAARIRSNPTGSSPLPGIPAMCHAASSPTSSKTSASLATNSSSSTSSPVRFPVAPVLRPPAGTCREIGRGRTSSTPPRRHGIFPAFQPL